MSSTVFEPVRLDFSAVADAVGRLNEAGLVAGGGVIVINLGAIRTAMAERWPSRRDRVWEHAERTLTRVLGPAAMVVRAGDDDLLLAQPGADRHAALGLALQGLREVITYFLGEVKPSDLKLRQVDSINGSELICRDLPLSALAAPHEIVATLRPKPQPPARASPPWKVFAGFDGGAIRVTCALDQLILLKSGAMAGCRLRPAVADVSGAAPIAVRLSAMDWRDAERVDITMMEQAPDVLSTQPATPMFVLPASFSTLSSQRGRRLFMDHVENLGRRFERRVAIEIRDLRGVPASRLAEVVSLIKPVCHAVLGEVEPDRIDIAATASCGLNGLSVRPRRDWTRDARQIEQFASLGELARRIAPIALTRAFTAEGLEHLGKAGFSHATIGAEQLTVAEASAA